MSAGTFDFGAPEDATAKPPRGRFEVHVAAFQRRAKCQSCGAEIVWWRHPTTGRRMPLEAKTAIPADHRTGVLYVEAHWAYCPQADAWRER